MRSHRVRWDARFGTRGGRLARNHPRAALAEALEPRALLSLSVPALSSIPSAHAKLFLDFDGDPQRRWGSWAGFGGDLVPPTPAFNTDGDPNNFSAKELDQIRQIWAIVA